MWTFAQSMQCKYRYIYIFHIRIFILFVTRKYQCFAWECTCYRIVSEICVYRIRAVLGSSVRGNYSIGRCVTTRLRVASSARTRSLTLPTTRVGANSCVVSAATDYVNNKYNWGVHLFDSRRMHLICLPVLASVLSRAWELPNLCVFVRVRKSQRNTH